MSVRRWRSVLGVGLVFVLGLLSGAAVATILHFRFVSRPDLPDRMAAVALRHLTRDLDLTEEQQNVVREAMQESRRELRALQEEMGPRMDATFQKTRDRIRAVLNEEQRKELDEMVERRRSIMGRLFGRPRFGPPGPGHPFERRPHRDGGRPGKPGPPPWERPPGPEAPPPGDAQPPPSPEAEPTQE
jgi:hypothetical protein